jgi:hypothetical protein
MTLKLISSPGYGQTNTGVHIGIRNVRFIIIIIIIIIIIMCYVVLSYRVLVTTRHLRLYDCLLTFLYYYVISSSACL